MYQKLAFLISCNLMLMSFISDKLSAQDPPIDYVEMSAVFIEDLKAGKDVKQIIDQLAFVDESELEEQLDSDAKKYAFWINVYNGYIIYILKEKPGLYEDRRQFFKKEYINIGGRNLSFANIEHGIIRGSQFEYFLGYVRNPFAPRYQRKYRPSERDWRVHFALNCGAKSCPPVAILRADRIESQFSELEKTYLQKVTSYNPETNEVTTTPLMSWFRGDFGGKKGAKKILKRLDLIPSVKVDLKFGPYDWTIDLDNFIDI